MPDSATPKPRPRTELRRQDKRAAEAAEREASPLAPRSRDDRAPGGDEDDLFNDMPV